MPHPLWKLLSLILLLLVIDGDGSLLNAQNRKKAPPTPKKSATPKSATPKSGTPAAPEESPLLIEPQTPAGFFRAAVLMHKLARPNLARRYLQKLINANPDDATLLKMRDAFGPADFLRLNNDKRLRPLSSDLHKRVNALFRKRGANPKFIDRILQSLINGSADDRQVALITLQNTGPAVIPRMLKLVVNSKSSIQTTNLQEALVRMGTPAVRPLIASLDGPNEKARISSLFALGRIGGEETLPYLWFSAFSKSQSVGVQTAARGALARIYQTSLNKVDQMAPANIAAELKRITLEHFRRDFKWTRAADRKVELWYWNTAKQTVERTRVTPAAASLYLGSRFAKQALDLSPENRESQALFLAITLAAAADPKWERPLPTGPGSAHDLALRSGSEVVSDALRISIKNANASAAIAALVVLRQVATKALVTRQSRTQSSLLSALNYPDIRVQMAAATTILHIDPDSPFRGSHRIVAILARSLHDGGSSRAIVVHANLSRARTIGDFLNAMGFSSQVAQTGRGGFMAAANRGDVDLIVLDTNTIRWSLSQTVANLRADARTAGIPIAIYGSPDLRERILRHLNRYPLITYVTQSLSSRQFAQQVEPFLTTIKTPPPTAKQKAEQRQAAAFWLAYIARGQRDKVFDLKPAEKALLLALSDPDLAANVIQALAAIPTRSAQASLQEVAVNDRVNPKIREAAALQLAYHIQRFGLVLADSRVVVLKRSYAAATQADLATALATVLGSLKPNRRLIGNRLRRFSPPPLRPGQ